MANAVGLAIAERTLAAQFNQPDNEIVDHFTYVFMGDGCLMEGISHEVCSLAGTLGLGKLCLLYTSVNGLRLLLFIVNKQAALLVNKLDAQMAAFQ